MITLAVGFAVGVAVWALWEPFWARVDVVLRFRLDAAERDRIFGEGYDAGRSDRKIEQWPARPRRDA